ncbi:MAG: glycerophosphodiester phosphodiesterase [Coxiellaceae bacterium]|nr:glycerophosphodiester phosphodiesterase [Coxiellaceae bacterium]
MNIFYTFLFCILFVLPQYVLAMQSYGHRGARGLSPENTIPAYQDALALGVDYIDMDIGMSKDGVIVVAHNYALNPDITKKPDGEWLQNDELYIKDLTFKQIERYDVGSINPVSHYAYLFPIMRPVPHTHIPSLVQVIDYAERVTKGKIHYQIEVKTDPTQPNATFAPAKIAKALAKIMAAKGVVNRTEVQAFDYRVLLALQKDNVNIKTAYLTQKDDAEHYLYSKDPKQAGLWSAGHTLNEYGGSIPKMVKALGGTCWDPQDTMVTKKEVDEAHQLGLRVVVWHWPHMPAPPNIKMMQRLMDWGVDGIITDRPDILRGLMAARHLPLAPAYVTTSYSA